jgi:hypothetical protein
MKPTITITPSEYKGWTLCYNESHDRQSDWQASKGAMFIGATKPESLICKIDESEKVTVRFTTPIPILHWDYQERELLTAKIHTLADNRVYYRNKDGEQVVALFDLQPGQNEHKKFYHDDKHNVAIIRKRRVLQAQRNKLDAEINELGKRFHRVTDADILVAADADSRTKA